MESYIQRSATGNQALTIATHAVPKDAGIAGVQALEGWVAGHQLWQLLRTHTSLAAQRSSNARSPVSQSVLRGQRHMATNTITLLVYVYI